MKQDKNQQRKQLPEKSRVTNPKRGTNTSENYGTKERPSHPKGADRMNEDFANPGADQDIIRETLRPADTTRRRKGPGR